MGENPMAGIPNCNKRNVLTLQRNSHYYSIMSLATVIDISMELSSTQQAS